MLQTTETSREVLRNLNKLVTEQSGQLERDLSWVCSTKLDLTTLQSVINSVYSLQDTLGQLVIFLDQIYEAVSAGVLPDDTISDVPVEDTLPGPFPKDVEPNPPEEGTFNPEDDDDIIIPDNEKEKESEDDDDMIIFDDEEDEEEDENEIDFVEDEEQDFIEDDEEEA